MPLSRSRITPISRLVLLGTLLAWPAVVMASPPAPVTGIAAAVEHGAIVAQWNVPEKAGDISAYRVYLSRRSILDNGGDYDDYQTVNGAETRAVVTEFPAGPVIYLSVLAVNAKGEEGVTFAEEARVEIPVSVSPATPADEVPAPPQEIETMVLLNARSLSQTGILLSFSHPVKVDPSLAGQAFFVTDASGASLLLTRLIADGRTVTLHTVPQKLSVPYRITVSPVVYGEEIAGERIPLDPQGDAITFMSADGGTMVAAAPAGSVLPTVPAATPLANSGASAVAVAVMSGGIAGWRRWKKRI